MILMKIDHESGAALRVRLDRTSKAIDRALSQGIRSGGIHVTTVLKRDILAGQVLHKRSGNLTRAVFSEMLNPMTSMVGVGKEAPYAKFLNNGTRPHIIEAKNGKALKFTPGAGAIRASGFVSPRNVNRVIAANAIFRRSVMHPGTPPYRFMELALAMSTPDIRAGIEKRLAATLRTGDAPQ